MEIQLCGNTCSACSTVSMLSLCVCVCACVGRFFSYVLTLFPKPDPPGFSFPVRGDVTICSIKRKKGPPAAGALQYLFLTTSAPFSPHQPLQNTHILCPFRTHHPSTNHHHMLLNPLPFALRSFLAPSLQSSQTTMFFLNRSPTP